MGEGSNVEGFGTFKNVFFPGKESSITIKFTIQGTGSATMGGMGTSAVQWSSDQGDVTMAIYDRQGLLVKRLSGVQTTPGTHEIPWDGQTEQGTLVTSGTYMLTMKRGDKIYKRKVVVVK